MSKSTNIFEVEVTRAKEIKEGKIAFDMKVNGISVYNCWYVKGEKNGKEYEIINLPQYKGSNDKYYSYVWFPISRELKEDIISQLEKLI